MADRPRHWQLAGFLSFLAPGLGQIYNGEWAKALVLLTVTIPVAIFLVLLLFTPYFHLAIALAPLFALTVVIYSILDAIVVSRRQSETYELKWFNRVLVYVGLIFVVGIARGGLTTLLRENFMQAFRVASESMMPTLKIGDFVFVDKRPGARIPSRGDVIVFNYPQDLRRQ